MPHIGYDIDGKKVFRPAQGDELDKFLSTVDDPSSWWAHPSFLLEYIIEFLPGRLPLTKTLRRILSYPQRSLTLSEGCRRVRTRMRTMILTNPQWSGSPVRVKKRLCLCLLHLNPNVDGGPASGKSRKLANHLTPLRCSDFNQSCSTGHENCSGHQTGPDRSCQTYHRFHKTAVLCYLE
jgi:hypothetical protein